MAMSQLPSIDCRKLTIAQRRSLRSRATQLLVSGGFGSGKTMAHALKTLQLKQENPDTPGLILAPTWSVLWSTTMRRFFWLLKRCGIPWQVRDRQGECYLDLGDGVPIFMRSAKNVETFDGLDVGWITSDETRHYRKEAYHVALGRRRVKCPFPQAAFFTTPNMWLIDEFTDKPGRQLIIAPTQENAKNLAPGYIDNLRLSYSSRMQKAYIDGQGVVLEGSVFEQFDGGPSSPWIVNYDAAKFPQRKTYVAIDPGYRRSAVLFVHRVSDTEWIVFDELMLDDTTDMTMVEHINAKQLPIDEIWVDPAADNTQSLVGFDTIQALRSIKTRARDPLRMLVDPWRSISYGVDKVRTMLGGEGLPTRLFFAKQLVDYERNRQRGIIKDLAAYKYPECKDGRPVTDIPVKDGISDHSCDGLRYGVVGIWLTTPSLRAKDPVMARNAHPGWRIAAA